MLRWILGCFGSLLIGAAFFALGHFAGQGFGYMKAEANFMPKVIRAAYGLPIREEFLSDWARGNLEDLVGKHGSATQLKITELHVEGGKGHAAVIAKRNGVDYEESITFSNGRLDLVEEQ